MAENAKTGFAEIAKLDLVGLQETRNARTVYYHSAGRFRKRWSPAWIAGAIVLPYRSSQANSFHSDGASQRRNTASTWRAALGSLQSGHSLFSVCIDIDGESNRTSITWQTRLFCCELGGSGTV
jgi:hypothetical protein